MKITEQQLAYAAKALGVEEIILQESGWTDEHSIATVKNVGHYDFGPGFAEWAVPVLEERHDLDLRIYRIKEHGPDSPWYCDDVGSTLCEDGPDIDTAVFLLSAKIGEGME